MSSVGYTNDTHKSRSQTLTNYIVYQSHGSTSTRVGHYDQDVATIQPLSFASGTALQNLYEVIEAGENGIEAAGQPVPVDSVKISPPLYGRDILCVGKNYSEHAKEFNSSGFDSSDKVDQPSHPVIFTKRFTSIIAHGDEIYPHPKFTSTLDYEGELGVIIGKDGFRISEADAMDHVWGYTIINDMTARERQRDHKQFYIGKSADTFCPMGPIAVPKEKLNKTLQVQTRVNGEVRQNATTDDLIFSIPYLIMTMSEGQTLMRGDVLATGTPAGVGIGRKPPIYLQPGDVVEVSIDGLGTLRNRIGSTESKNYIVQRVESTSCIPITNSSRTPGQSGLILIQNKLVHYKRLGERSGPPVVFVHGLGGSMDTWTPLISALKLDKSHDLHLYDFEGHGLSPTSPLSRLSIESLAQDVHNLLEHAQISQPAIIFGHSMGCLIAGQLALSHPKTVRQLILLGPPTQPLPETASKATYQRAETVRKDGMDAVLDAVVSAGTSEATKTSNGSAVAAVRLSLAAQDPESYAKACSALAGTNSRPVDFSRIAAETVVVTGADDKVSPPTWCKQLSENKNVAKSTVLPDVGHWHTFESVNGVADAVAGFLRKDQA